MISQNQKSRQLNPMFLDENEIITWSIKSSISFIDSYRQDKVSERGYLFINSRTLIFQPKNSNASLYKFKYRNIIKELQVSSDKQFEFDTREIVQVQRHCPPTNYLHHYLKKNNQRTIKIFIEEDINSKEIILWIEMIRNMLQKEYLLENYNQMIINLMISENKKYLQGIKMNFSNEQVLLSNMICCRIKPMNEQWGFLNLTSRYIYFIKIIWKKKNEIKKISINQIIKIMKRRYQMEHKAVEIEIEDKIYYFNFINQEQRESFYQDLLKLSKVQVLTEQSLPQLTQKWVNDEISNFQYLYDLNQIGHRSFEDFSQYPIFPWIITNFEDQVLDLTDESNYRDLSKPIGALNKNRLEEYLERYQQNEDNNNKFLYGSHYSSPGYVIGYLVRKFPFYMLKIQSGKYDSPNRFFHSIQEEWEKCYNHIGCVKELIPEFYMDDPKFLLNSLHIDFGIRSDNISIDDVVLPKWAKSATQFLEIQKQALESEYVSKNLNQWIDLIFGYKQQGEEALINNNLFLKTSYEDQINYSEIQDTLEKKGLKTQIQEYGQAPKQLFNKPHPVKNKYQNQIIEDQKIEKQVSKVQNIGNDVIIKKNRQLNQIKQIYCQYDYVQYIQIFNDDVIIITNKALVILNQENFIQKKIFNLNFEKINKVKNTYPNLLLIQYQNMILIYHLIYQDIIFNLKTEEEKILDFDCNQKTKSMFVSFSNGKLIQYKDYQEECLLYEKQVGQIQNIFCDQYKEKRLLYLIDDGGQIYVYDLEEKQINEEFFSGFNLINKAYFSKQNKLFIFIGIDQFIILNSDGFILNQLNKEGEIREIYDTESYIYLLYKSGKIKEINLETFEIDQYQIQNIKRASFNNKDTFLIMNTDFYFTLHKIIEKQIFKDAHEFTEENELNYSQLTKEKLINLDKGGSIISTKIGNIQYGMPPETVKDSINQGIQVPEYYVIPSQTFDWVKGINLMEFEFPVYFNFFVRKKTKTKLICDDKVRKQIEIIFQETLLGPKQFQNFDKEFSNDYLAKPNLQKELKHFAVNPFEPTMPLRIDMFLEFLIFDEKNQIIINKKINEDNKQKMCKIKIQKSNNLFLIFQDDEFLQKFEDKVHIHQKKFSVYQKVSKTDLYSTNVQFIPPAFGFTMLGSSHGFDACGSTSGFILWVNKKGIMIDPPPFSSQALRKNGIPPNLIEKIIITHCHADHDAGIFQKIIEATQVEFITTPTIINSFLRKYSAISNIQIKELKKLFQYRSVKIGHPTLICGARFLFSYAFHSIPCLRFEVEFQGKKFFFSSDTFYNPEALKKIYEKGIFSKERYLSLSNIDFSQYDAILHEAGVPPIHTPTSVLQNLPEKVRKNLYLYHIAEKDVVEGLKRALVGLDNTVVIIKENKNRNKIVENLDLLCCVELIHWVPFNRIIEIIEIFEEKTYQAEEIIIQEGTIGTKFYIIKEGEVVIYCNDPSNYFQKSSFRGDYFGESALIGNGQRLATVKAVKTTTLLEIKSSDFLWTFNYDSDDHPKYSLSPIKMIKNLSDIRQKKNSEFINYNKIIEKMTEAQKCTINMFLKEQKVKKNQLLWKNGSNPTFCLFAFEGELELKIPLSKLPSDSQIEKGTLIGDFPYLINNKPCQSSLRCLSDGTIYILEKKFLKEFLLQYPGIQILLQESYLFK